MEKRILILIMCVMMLSPNAIAYDFEVDGLWYNLSPKGDDVTLVGSSQRNGNFIIPSKISYRNREFVVSSIKEGAFYGYDFSELVIPSTVKIVPNRGFDSSVKGELLINNGVQVIGVDAFADCSFQNLEIPNSVFILHDKAFFRCKNLKNINIGTGLEKINRGAFLQCDKIEKIVCLAENPPIPYITDFSNRNLDFFDNTVYQFATLKVLKRSLAKYKSSYIWGKFHNIDVIDPETVFTDFEQRQIEWEAMDKILSNYNSPFRICKAYDRSTCYLVTKTTNNKGKVKEKLKKVELPFKKTDGDYGGYIDVAYSNKNKYMHSKFMLHGYIQFLGMETLEEFYSEVYVPSKDGFNMDCILSSGRHFNIKLRGPERYYDGSYAKFSEINPFLDDSSWERTHLKSITPNRAWIDFSFNDGDGNLVEYTIKSDLPDIYIEADE